MQKGKKGRLQHDSKEIKKDKAIKTDVLRDILHGYFKITKAEVLGEQLPQLLTLFVHTVNVR